MASKPTLADAEWATNATISGSPIVGQNGLTTKDDPGLATRQAGGVPGKGIRARTLNFLLHQFYSWAAYLSDGALTGAHSVTNSTGNVAFTVANTGASQAVTITQSTSGGTAVGITQSNASATALSVAMPAAASVVAASFEGGIDVTAGDVVAPLGIRQMAAAGIYLRDTQDYQYCSSAGSASTPSRTIMLPLSDGFPSGNWQLGTPVTGEWWLEVSSPASSDKVRWEFHLPSGAELTQVRAGVDQGATAGADMTLSLWRIAYDKSSTGTSGSLDPSVNQLGSTQTAADSGTDVLAISGLTESFLRSDQGFIVEITASNSGSGSDPDKILWVEVTFKDPGPRNY